MTDTVKAWIEERRTINNKATSGPWMAGYSPEPGDCVIPNDAQSTGEAVAVTRLSRRTADADAIADAHNMFPRALNALEAVNAQIDRMEADANTYGDGGHDLACDALFAYVMTLRQAIEGAINE